MENKLNRADDEYMISRVIVLVEHRLFCTGQTPKREIASRRPVSTQFRSSPGLRATQGANTK